MLTKLKLWLGVKWSEVSTKLGLLLTAISAVSQQYVSYDVRFSYIGAVAGVLLVLWNEKKQ